MQEFFKQAGSVFLGVAAALGLLAIPTYNWLTRELDIIHNEVANLKMSVVQIDQTTEKIDATTQATQASSSESLRKSKFNADTIAYLASFNSNNVELADKMLGTSLPSDVYNSWVSEDKIQFFKAVRSNDENILFLDIGDLPKFTLDDRRMVRSIEASGGPKFIVWDPAEFPGFDFE